MFKNTHLNRIFKHIARNTRYKSLNNIKYLTPYHIKISMDIDKIISDLIINDLGDHPYPIEFNIRIPKYKKFKRGENKIKYIDTIINDKVKNYIPHPITIRYNGIYYNIRWIQDIKTPDDIYDLYYNKKIKVYNVRIHGFLKKITDPIFCILLNSSSYKNLP